MNRFIILLSVSVFLFLTSLSQAFSEDACEYSGQIAQCYNLNDSGGDARTIEDYVCLQSREYEKIAYQVVLDMRFKEVDEEVISYLEGFENDKEKYFGARKRENFYEGVKDIFDMFKAYGEVWKKYNNLCLTTSEDSIIATTVQCLGGQTIIGEVDGFFVETDCTRLATLKSAIYEKVAIDIMKLNKNQVRRDANKRYVQEQRERTNALIGVFHTSIGYIERILYKWPSKTQDPY